LRIVVISVIEFFEAKIMFFLLSQKRICIFA